MLWKNLICLPIESTGSDKIMYTCIGSLAQDHFSRDHQVDTCAYVRSSLLRRMEQGKVNIKYITAINSQTSMVI